VIISEWEECENEKMRKFENEKIEKLNENFN
jgi:hypothetical protein